MYICTLIYSITDSIFIFDMKNTGLFILLLSFLFVSCSDHVDPNFSFSPLTPKCGEQITFNNLTTGDEDWTADSWNWEFGDDGKSTLKSPTHIYRKPGIYSVSLMVDSSKNLVKKMNITVFDSIPTILVNVDSVKFYQTVRFSVLIYNPSGKAVTYQWSVSNNASPALDSITSKAATVDVFFNKRNYNEEVKLKVTVGDSVYNVSKTLYVHDYKTKSILMAKKDGKILRQRIFLNGVEAYTELPVMAGKHPFNIYAVADNLYVFDAGTNIAYKPNWMTDTSGDGNIRAIDLKDFVWIELANNRNASSHFGFYNGFVTTQHIYWTDYSEFIYRTGINEKPGNFEWKGSSDAQTAVPYYLAKTNRLGYYGNGLDNNQLSGGIRYFDMAYFWAKGGNGRGIYRFVSNDILAANANSNTPLPSLGAILTNFAIRAFAIDEINLKIYFSVTAPDDKIGFWVSNLNGSNPQRIEAAPMDDTSLYITGIAIDNESNRVYWAYRSPESVGASAPIGTWDAYYVNNPTHKSGVKMASLATVYKPVGTIEYFLKDVAVYGIALDKVRR